MAAPMPREPPVTRASLPERVLSLDGVVMVLMVVLPFRVTESLDDRLNIRRGIDRQTGGVGQADRPGFCPAPGDSPGATVRGRGMAQGLLRGLEFGQEVFGVGDVVG